LLNASLDKIEERYHDLVLKLTAEYIMNQDILIEGTGIELSEKKQMQATKMLSYFEALFDQNIVQAEQNQNNWIKTSEDLIRTILINRISATQPNFNLKRFPQFIESILEIYRQLYQPLIKSQLSDVSTFIAETFKGMSRSVTTITDISRMPLTFEQTFDFRELLGNILLTLAVGPELLIKEQLVKQRLENIADKISWTENCEDERIRNLARKRDLEVAKYKLKTSLGVTYANIVAVDATPSTIENKVLQLTVETSAKKKKGKK
jgi:hypothetical protein